MKRVFVALCTLAVAFVLFYLNAKPVLSGWGDKFEVYVLENGSNAQIISLSEQEFLFCRDVTGESVELLGDSTTAKRILDLFGAKIMWVERLEHGISYYGYSDKIRYRKVISSQAVNIQVFVSDERIVVGSPLIYGSF
jgi:hypothetical protein